MNSNNFSNSSMGYLNCYQFYTFLTSAYTKNLFISVRLCYNKNDIVVKQAYFGGYMIDQERVREMTKLAAYEQREGKKYRQVIRYYRSDFAARHLLRAFLCGTVVYGIFLLMWGVYHLEELMEQLDSMDLIAFGTAVLVRYLFFLAAYLIAVDVYANVFYAAGKKSMKRHYRRLKHLGKLYDEQENRTAPMRH